MKNNINRLYNDLAWLWPIWEDVEEYRRESEYFTELIKRYSKIEVNSLSDMGCGIGKFIYHLKQNFVVTGIDISQDMLSNAKKLNPECTFHQADMRDFNLKQQFDSVLINDSITYTTNQKELLTTFQNAYKHLKAGGVMVAFPDFCRESFPYNSTEVSIARASLKPDNIDVTFVENRFDPNPEDECFETTLIYLIREDGKLRVEHDFHILGLFTLDVWRKLLSEAGFKVNEHKSCNKTTDLPVFACVKA